MKTLSSAKHFVEHEDKCDSKLSGQHWPTRPTELTEQTEIAHIGKMHRAYHVEMLSRLDSLSQIKDKDKEIPVRRQVTVVTVHADFWSRHVLLKTGKVRAHLDSWCDRTAILNPIRLPCRHQIYQLSASTEIASAFLARFLSSRSDVTDVLHVQ